MKLINKRWDNSGKGDYQLSYDETLEHLKDFRDWCDMWSEKDACVPDEKYEYFQEKYCLYYSDDYVTNGYDMIIGDFEEDE